MRSFRSSSGVKNRIPARETKPKPSAPPRLQCKGLQNWVGQAVSPAGPIFRTSSPYTRPLPQNIQRRLDLAVGVGVACAAGGLQPAPVHGPRLVDASQLLQR